MTVISFILAAAGAYFGMRAELHSVDQRVQQLATVPVLTARQNEALLQSSGASIAWNKPPAHR